MSQLVYIIIVFVLSFILSFIYLFCINMNKFLKICYSLISVIIFSLICYHYNYFIFNEYVVLGILYGVYMSCVVKNCVKKVFK